MKHRFFIRFLLSLCIFFFCSCSLIYRTELSEEEESELSLYDLVMTKVSNGKKESLIKAKQMEQYRKDEHMYAKDVSFILYDKNEAIETEGSAGFMKSEKDELLVFSGGVSLTSYKEDVYIEAENLRVDTEREQLTSAEDDTILIEYGINEGKNTKLFIHAQTIAASGVSNTIRISGKVNGLIIVDDENRESNQLETVDFKDANERGIE
jgi:LPS export ABC transporter protein LptC